MPIVADTYAIEKRLTDMQIAIRDLADKDIGKELHDWQVEDMKRTFPETEEPTFLSSETTIYPRSRTYGKQGKGKEQRESLFKRHRPIAAMPRLKGTPGSKRPILRPMLYDKLVERMGALMTRVLSWRSTSPS